MSDKNDKPQQSEDELIDAALAALDQGPLPTSTLPEPDELTPAEANSTQEPGQFTPPADSDQSPTLAALDESRRPKAATVCERCPNSVWFASPAEVKCYCRVMFLVTWTNKDPSQITHCDGEYLGQDQG
jgi:hypothetical protein